MSFEMMAPLMFGGLVVMLLIGYPVAFSLAAVGLISGLVGIAHGSIEPALLQALPERVLGIMANSTLLALQGLSEIVKRVAFLKGLIPASSFEKKGHES